MLTSFKGGTGSFLLTVSSHSANKVKLFALSFKRGHGASGAHGVSGERSYAARRIAHLDFRMTKYPSDRMTKCRTVKMSERLSKQNMLPNVVGKSIKGNATLISICDLPDKGTVKKATVFFSRAGVGALC